MARAIYEMLAADWQTVTYQTTETLVLNIWKCHEQAKWVTVTLTDNRVKATVMLSGELKWYMNEIQ